MKFSILGAFVAFAVAYAYLFWLMYRSAQRRAEITQIGVDLVKPKQVMALYRHDRATVRLLERILQQDRAIPILSDVDRDEAGRLIKAFYDDKGD